MDDEFEIHKNKRTDRTYISPAFINKNPLTNESKSIRIVSRVIDNTEGYSFAKIKGELVIRVTSHEREELIAKFYEDDRSIFILSFQKFTTKSGNPHNLSFSFVGDEIRNLYDFITNIVELPLNSSASIKIDDNNLNEILLSKERTKKLLRDNEEIFTEIFKNDLTKSDIINLGYRKKQLKNFEKLLNDSQHFAKTKTLYKVESDERLWQIFFEKNTWIFGYGLNYIFNSPLEDKKLEQVVSGYDFNSSGKRIDALLKTRGIISSIIFAEIKTPNTFLIKNVKNAYRPESWQISDEFAGAIAQIQKTVQKSIKNIATKTEIKDDKGNLTSEKLFLYKPKSILIIGNLKEFMSENGINEDKYSSFELFRQELNSLDVITFDELYERAKYIIKSTEEANK